MQFSALFSFHWIISVQHAYENRGRVVSPIWPLENKQANVFSRSLSDGLLSCLIPDGQGLTPHKPLHPYTFFVMFIFIAKVELSVSIPLDIVHKWWQMLHIMVESSPAVSPHQGQQHVWHRDLSQDPLLTFLPMCFSKMISFLVLFQDIFYKSYRLNPTHWDHGLYQKLPGLVGHQRAV